MKNTDFLLSQTNTEHTIFAQNGITLKYVLLSGSMVVQSFGD